MIKLLYILPFLALNLQAQDCRFVVTDSLRLDVLNLDCQQVYMDSYSYIEVDSLIGCGWVLYGKEFKNDSISTYIRANRFRQYRTPVYTDKLPVIKINEFKSDSIIISQLVKWI